MGDENLKDNVAYKFYIKNRYSFETFLEKHYMFFNFFVYLQHLGIFVMNFCIGNSKCSFCKIYNISNKLYFEYEDENIFKEIDKNIIVDENFYLELFS